MTSILTVYFMIGFVYAALVVLWANPVALKFKIQQFILLLFIWPFALGMSIYIVIMSAREAKNREYNDYE